MLRYSIGEYESPYVLWSRCLNGHPKWIVLQKLLKLLESPPLPIRSPLSSFHVRYTSKLPHRLAITLQRLLPTPNISPRPPRESQTPFLQDPFPAQLLERFPAHNQIPQLLFANNCFFGKQLFIWAAFPGSQSSSWPSRICHTPISEGARTVLVLPVLWQQLLVHSCVFRQGNARQIVGFNIPFIGLSPSLL
jgi:hypothetical protein